MRFSPLIILPSFLLLGLCAFADENAVPVIPGKYLLKTMRVDFDPTEVYLIEETQDKTIRQIALPFRVLRSRLEEADSKRLIATVAGLDTDAKPLSVVMVSAYNVDDTMQSESSPIEASDIVAEEMLIQLHQSILDLRGKYSAVALDREQQQRKIEDLRAQAATLARLNRLVEAQSTAANLRRKLDGLLSDKTNVQLLLSLIQKQSTTSRLANTESALSRDVRLLSSESAVSPRQKKLVLNDAKREAAQRIIEKAKDLDINKLKALVEYHRGDPNHSEPVGAEQDGRGHVGIERSRQEQYLSDQDEWERKNAER